jgi:signal transduction histidine kinase
MRYDYIEPGEFMVVQSTRRRILFTQVALYLAFAAAAARGGFELWATGNFWLMLVLLAIYLVSLIAETYLVPQSLVYLHIINGLQTAIALALVCFIGKEDYFALLFIPPCTQSILYFPRKTALIWIGAIILLMETALLACFPLDQSVGFAIIYPTAIFLFTSLCYLAKQAEEAQSRSEILLADLQVANQKLQLYSEKVEELAATNERNRLARELHDSVTQIIFGLTLSAQAARILIERNSSCAVLELDNLQVLAQKALAEMRSLIQELHPNTRNEDGLIIALRKMVVERKTHDGLSVDLQLIGAQHIPASIERELIRVTQEALTNIVKHAHVDQAIVRLNLEDSGFIRLDIADAGAGFDTHHVKNSPGHLGLDSMRERVESLGGTLVVESQPGEGTHLGVIIGLAQETQHA